MNIKYHAPYMECFFSGEINLSILIFKIHSSVFSDRNNDCHDISFASPVDVDLHFPNVGCNVDCIVPNQRESRGTDAWMEKVLKPCN